MTVQTKKLLIEISNNEYYRCVEEAEESVPTDLEEAIANGIDVNELTNGQAFMTMFPDAEVELTKYHACVRVDKTSIITFDLKWWNAKRAGGNS